MDFSDALRAVKDGKRVYRRAWEGKTDLVGAWMELIHPGANLAPLLAMGYDAGDEEEVLLRTFGKSDFDLLADDWEIKQ